VDVLASPGTECASPAPLVLLLLGMLLDVFCFVLFSCRSLCFRIATARFLLSPPPRFASQQLHGFGDLDFSSLPSDIANGARCFMGDASVPVYDGDKLTGWVCVVPCLRVTWTTSLHVSRVAHQSGFVRCVVSCVVVVVVVGGGICLTLP